MTNIGMDSKKLEPRRLGSKNPLIIEKPAIIMNGKFRLEFVKNSIPTSIEKIKR